MRDDDAIREYLDDEHRDGYFDGHETDAPTPSENRSEAYRHSWAIGRAEREKRQVPPAWASRYDAKEIETRERLRRSGLEISPWVPLSWVIARKEAND